jgi:hypothetical protein
MICAKGEASSDDHRDIADAVRKEAPAFADFRHEDSGDRRADDARAVEHGRVQRYGVHQILLADHVNEKGLAAWDVEGVDDAEQRGENEDVPDLNDSGERQSAQNKGENHRSGLGSDDDLLAVFPVGDDAPQRSHQENRELARESDRP